MLLLADARRVSWESLLEYSWLCECTHPMSVSYFGQVIQASNTYKTDEHKEMASNRYNRMHHQNIKFYSLSHGSLLWTSFGRSHFSWQVVLWLHLQNSYALNPLSFECLCLIHFLRGSIPVRSFIFATIFYRAFSTGNMLREHGYYSFNMV